MADVVLKNVSKTFENGITGVEKLSLHVHDKELVVLVGPSGCGKSTTLRMIAGLEEVSSGEIYIDGLLVNDLPPGNRDIAMVFQNYALYPHMTVFDNMAFGLKLRKYPKREIETRVREAAEILGILALLDRKPKSLSGGQRQRVAVGRAIVRRPKVFLFDEPLSNLDAKLRLQMRAEISKLHSRLEATMVYVTHDQVEAMTMADRIVLMKEGRVQQVDIPLNLYNQPANTFVASFIGSPGMNFIEGRLVLGQGEGLVFTNGLLKLPVSEEHFRRVRDIASQEVVLGLRPEDLHAVPLTDSVVKVTGTVEVVEPMGNEAFVYLTAGSDSLVMRVLSDELPTVGEKLNLIFDLRRAHFFSRASGDRLV